MKEIRAGYYAPKQAYFSWVNDKDINNDGLADALVANAPTESQARANVLPFISMATLWALLSTHSTICRSPIPM